MAEEPLTRDGPGISLDKSFWVCSESTFTGEYSPLVVNSPRKGRSESGDR